MSTGSNLGNTKYNFKWNQILRRDSNSLNSASDFLMSGWELDLRLRYGLWQVDSNDEHERKRCLDGSGSIWRKHIFREVWRVQLGDYSLGNVNASSSFWRWIELRTFKWDIPNPELGTIEWWISGLMLDPLFRLISRLNID